MGFSLVYSIRNWYLKYEFAKWYTRIKSVTIGLIQSMPRRLAIRLDLPMVVLSKQLICVINGRKLKSRFWWITLIVRLIQQISYHVKIMDLVSIIVATMKMFYFHVLNQVRAGLVTSKNELVWYKNLDQMGLLRLKIKNNLLK